MSSAAFPFQPTPAAPFQFTPTLDGSQYTAVVTYNLFGAGLRKYLNLYNINGGAWILTIAIVGSTVDAPVNLVKGYFNTVLYYDYLHQQFVTVDP